MKEKWLKNNRAVMRRRRRQGKKPPQRGHCREIEEEREDERMHEMGEEREEVKEDETMGLMEEEKALEMERGRFFVGN